MRRRATLALLCAAAALASIPARAQSAPAPPPEVCLLYAGPPAALPERVEIFSAGLGDQRLEVGRDVIVVPQAASFELGRLPALAADCVARKVRAIAAVAPAAVEAARAATRTIPIVALDLETDPVAGGVAESLARPGGNVTGIYFDFPEFSAKQLELMAEALPGLKRIGVLWDPSTGTARVGAGRALAAARGFDLVDQQMTDLPGLEARFQVLADAKVQALLIISSPLVPANRKRFADLALAHRLPAITTFPEFAQAGGLMSYGPDALALYRPLGEIVGKILRGANPAELPIDRPSRMSLIINLATARALGVTLPPALLGRADEVIE
jgi:putative ABC transport system substrate-binding protein